jgi:GST-like protein
VLGQLGFFERFPKEKSPLASARFIAEADRLLTVMDKHLAESTYLAGKDYSIADISAYPWVVTATLHLQHLQHRLLDESIQRRRNAELAHATSIRLGYFDPSHRLGAVGPAEQRGPYRRPVLTQKRR